MTSDNVETNTRDLYRLLTADFMDVVENWITDDFVWINYLPEHIPFGGIYKGPEGLMQYGRALVKAIELKPLHVDDILVKGNNAVIIGVERGTRVKATGKLYDMDWVHVVKYENNGKISYLREYNQYEEMAAAFSP